MQKIISVFQRNYEGDRLIRDEVVPGAEWVLAGEGSATRKFDGACCMLRGADLYKRRELRMGATPPPGFEPAQEADDVTGAVPGWMPVGDGPEDQWFRAALFNKVAADKDRGFDFPSSGTYEAVGPHFGGGAHDKNPESLSGDILLKHGGFLLLSVPRTFDGIREYLAPADIEGIVFHHPDGRMAKVKKKDYGLPRKPTS